MKYPLAGDLQQEMSTELKVNPARTDVQAEKVFWAAVKDPDPSSMQVAQDVALERGWKLYDLGAEKLPRRDQPEVDASGDSILSRGAFEFGNYRDDHGVVSAGWVVARLEPWRLMGVTITFEFQHSDWHHKLHTRYTVMADALRAGALFAWQSLTIMKRVIAEGGTAHEQLSAFKHVLAHGIDNIDPTVPTELVRNPSSNLRYVAIDHAGDIVAVERTSDEALDVLRPGGGRIMVETIGPESPGLEKNPAENPASMPATALKQCGIAPISMADVMAYSLEEAHHELLTYFSVLRNKRGGLIGGYKTAIGMRDRFMGQNMKLSKAHPTERTHIRGLTLFPADKIRHYHTFDPGSGVTKLIEQLGWTTYDPNLPGKRPVWHTPDGGTMTTLCVGSNTFCRESCLVFTARNVADIYNHRRKAVATIALLQSPAAFGRMLLAAIEAHTRNSEKADIKPFVRLNVLSDVPWELVFPELFEHFEDTDLQFYDYTKVAGRDTPPNYDLTFSHSGTNDVLVASELERGRRVAVVFVGMKQADGEWVKFKKGTALPRSFMGMPVVDGDVTDLRPFDRAPCIVGLRWKTPGGQDIDPTEIPFVTPAYHTKAGVKTSLGRKRNPHHSDDVEYLTVPVTYRMQGVQYDDYFDSDE